MLGRSVKGVEMAARVLVDGGAVRDGIDQVCQCDGDIATQPALNDVLCGESTGVTRDLLCEAGEETWRGWQDIRMG